MPRGSLGVRLRPVARRRLVFPLPEGYVGWIQVIFDSPGAPELRPDHNKGRKWPSLFTERRGRNIRLTCRLMIRTLE